MEPVTTALLAIQGAAMVGNFVTGLMAAKDAKKINQETYERLAKTALQYQQEMEGILPPGTVSLPKLQEFKRVVSDYVPEIAQYVPEATPQQVTESGVTTERQAQKQALQQYGRLAQAGYDPIAAAQQEAALSAGAAQASVARQTALREAAQRGMAGTGLETLAGMGAAEQAGVEGRQAALAAQQAAGQRRLSALGQYANLAGQMRQQGAETERANVGVMNAFNERMARNLNQYNQYVAELKNQAQMQNRTEQQRIAEMETARKNQELMTTWGAEQQAAEARRAARERAATTKYGIQTGLGELGAKMRGQESYQKYMPYEQAFSTVSSMAGKGLETGLRDYYSKKPKQPSNEDETQ